MDKYKEKTKCPKCGNEYITTEFLRDIVGGTIKRTCGRCGYWWEEMPLDEVEDE